MKTGLNTINTYIINSQFGETVPLTATATSSNVTFALPASAKNYEVIVTNAGLKTAYINFGKGAAIIATVPGTNGTTGAMPILAGAIYTFQKNSDAVQADTCAAICGGSDTTTLYFTSVQGS